VCDVYLNTVNSRNFAKQEMFESVLWCAVNINDSRARTRKI